MLLLLWCRIRAISTCLSVTRISRNVFNKKQRDHLKIPEGKVLYNWKKYKRKTNVQHCIYSLSYHMKQQQPLDLKNYSFLHDFGIKHFLLVNTIIRNSRDQNICLVPSPKYSIDKTRPSSPSPATMTTLVSSHTMSQLHQSSTTLTCSVCDRVKRI